MAGLVESISNLIEGSAEWSEEAKEELIQLKKEMATRVVDKMQEKKWDLAFSLGKDMLVDYLVDEWMKDWLVDELVLWNIIEMLSTSSEDLTVLREQIELSKSKDSLNELEEKVIKQIEWNWSISSLFKNQESSSWSTTSETTDSWTAESETPAESETSTGSETPTDTETSVAAWSETTGSETTESGQTTWDADYEDMTYDSAPVGEAKEIEKKQRMEWLFPDWVPQTEKEMKKYIKKIKVPILLANWKTKKLTLYVHKKLANEIKAIFQDMKKAWIKVNPDTTACFNWRKMRKSSKMSHHSYWSAIDVNRDVNGWVYWKTDQSSPYFNDQACVDIWKKHWFYWWWDWKPSNNDPMHFTYMNA